ADRLRGRDRRCDVSRLQELICAFGIGGPYAGEAIGHEFYPHRQIIRLALAKGGLLRGLNLWQNPKQVFDVMAYLMPGDITVGEVATAAEAPFHVLEEGRIEIDFLIPRAIEGPRGRLSAATA